MANPTPIDDAYVGFINQTLRVGQGEFVGIGQKSILGVVSGVGAISSAPVAFSVTSVVSMVRLSVGAGSIDLSAFTPAVLTTATIVPSVTGTGLPVTFGHAFPVGAVPSGTSVEVFGRTTQFDAKATHADGSVRHAILTALVDTTVGVSQVVQLRTRSVVGGVAITKSNILATLFDSSVSLNVGGVVYALTARNLLDGTVTPLLDHTHLSGPQCSEFVIGGKLRNGATPHAHLAAYFHVRAYGSAGSITRVRCDVVTENGFTFVAGSGLITHNPTVTVGGSVVYSAINYAQYHHTRFFASGWWGGNPQITFKHNSAYLIASKAVPNYEALTARETLLAGLNTTYTPGGNGPLRINWGDTGDHAQIGLMPEWDACYAVSTDVRALNSSIAASRSGGSFSFHYRDEFTGYPVSIDTYPTLDEQNYSAGLVQGTGGTAYTHDAAADASAHAPLLGYLAYLATGDYCHLEELHFQSNYFMIWRNYNGRSYLTGPQDGIVGLQNRGQAWGIRNLGAAAAITPDAHTLKNYFVNKVGNNIAHKTANWASPSKNVFGHVQDYDWTSGYAVPPKVTPFENDFYVMTFGWLVDLGFVSATTMRDWLSQSPAGRLGHNASGYCPHYSMPYAWYAGISPTPAGNTFYASWTALYQANYPTESAAQCPVGLLSGSYQNIPSSTDASHGFYGNLRPALAAAVDAGIATLATWNLFNSFATNDYTYSPRYNIVPKALSARPAWYLAQTRYTWKQFSGKPATAVNPCPAGGCSYSGTESFTALMDSWSGGVFDSKRNRHVFWGGGHNAYYGNEQLAWDLYTETWSRITQPKSPVVTADLVGGGGTNTTGYYTDGTPAARHTYNALAYDPIRDQMVSVYAGATAGQTGGQYSNCDAFSYAANTWSVKAVSPTLGSYGSPYGTMSATDAVGNIWSIYQGLAPLAKFDPAANTWTTYGGGYNYAGGPYCSAAIDTLRNRLVVIGGGYFTKTDLAAPGTTVNCGGSPTSAAFNGTAPGWVYDPLGDRFIGWVGGQTLYTVDAATLLTWGTIFIAGGSATPPDDTMAGQWRGTYGKFRYVPDLHGLSLVVQTFYDPFFFKL